MKYKVTLGNKVYEVEVEDGEAMLLDEYEAKAPVAAVSAPAAPAPAASVAAPVAVGPGEAVTAPMPGNILRVDVTVGAKVKAGDNMVILEAMKMENEIVAPRDGTVAQVLVAKGAVVDTGAPLVVLA